jgi:hypothetical protein
MPTPASFLTPSVATSNTLFAGAAGRSAARSCCSPTLLQQRMMPARPSLLSRCAGLQHDVQPSSYIPIAGCAPFPLSHVQG